MKNAEKKSSRRRIREDQIYESAQREIHKKGNQIPEYPAEHARQVLRKYFKINISPTKKVDIYIDARKGLNNTYSTVRKNVWNPSFPLMKRALKYSIKDIEKTHDVTGRSRLQGLILQDLEDNEYVVTDEVILWKDGVEHLEKIAESADTFTAQGRYIDAFSLYINAATIASLSKESIVKEALVDRVNVAMHLAQKNEKKNLSKFQARYDDITLLLSY